MYPNVLKKANVQYQMSFCCSTLNLEHLPFSILMGHLTKLCILPPTPYNKEHAVILELFTRNKPNTPYLQST